MLLLQHLQANNMANKSNHRTVVFLQDFATKKVGEEWACDGMIASSLIQRGIAELKSEDNSSDQKKSTFKKKQK